MADIEWMSNKFDEVFEFRQSLTNETDRGCALMAASYLEAELEKLLRKFLVDNDKIKDELFGHSHPLGSFSAKIDIAYLLGLIGPKIQRDLHLIRKIRNDFGHVAAPISFTDQAMSSRCRELHHDALGSDNLPRRKFTRVVLGVLAVVHGQLYYVNTIEEAEDLNINDKVKERYNALLKLLEDNTDA
jgi:DNA-binding MltR family transcriptional regulator